MNPKYCVKIKTRIQEIWSNYSLYITVHWEIKEKKLTRSIEYIQDSMKDNWNST